MEDQVFNYIDQLNTNHLNFVVHHIDEISDVNIAARAKISASSQAKSYNF